MKQIKQGLAPKLRFREFEKNGDWEETFLGNHCEITTGKLDANAMVERGQYRFYTCAKDYYLIDKYAFDTDALLVSGNGANVGYIHHYKGKFNAYQRTYVLDRFEQDIFFIKYYLEKNLHKRISTEKKDGNTPYIVMSTLTDMVVMLPKDKKEQQKIADCLSSLDELIEAEDQKLEALQHHKKGLMQELFPAEGQTIPKRRFPEFQSAPEWEKKTLGEVGEIVTGKTPSTADESLWNGDIQFVTPTDIKEEKYQWKTQRSIVGNVGTKILPKHSTMFTCIASIGKMSLSIRPCITNQQINSIIPNGNYKNEFVYYSLLNIAPLIKATQSNTALPIINKTDFSKFTLLTPITTVEQQKIADCLSSLDELIEAQIKKLESLRLHKKGLMQQLFPNHNQE